MIVDDFMHFMILCCFLPIFHVHVEEREKCVEQFTKEKENSVLFSFLIAVQFFDKSHLKMRQSIVVEPYK